MIGNRQGKTKISFDLVEWLSPSDLRDAVRKFVTRRNWPFRRRTTYPRLSDQPSEALDISTVEGVLT